jgi:anti-sigma-K factor RskA
MAQWNAIPVWRRRAPRALAMAVVVSLALPLAAQVQERVDHDAVYQIKDEGFQRSKVMEIAS